MCKSFLKRLLPIIVCGLSAYGHAVPTKTLVAWVYLDNTTQQGGSALTIQRGEQFDAIVFGEKAAGKWMAGSNYFRRTQDDQQSNAVETAAVDTLIQRNITVPGEMQQLLPGISGDALELEIVFAAQQAQEFGINLLCDTNGDNGFKIACDTVGGNLSIGYVTPSFQVKPAKDLTLRLFIDRSMIEVFVNERHAVVAWHKYPPNNRHISLFAKGGNLLVKKVTAWKLKSIYAGNCVFDSVATSHSCAHSPSISAAWQ